MIDYDKLQQILEDSMRVDTNAGIVPDNSSFIYVSNNRYVKEGTPYHIHYTTDFKEYYMTGGEHSVTSRLIEPLNGEDASDFTAYSNNYGKMYIPMADVFFKGAPEASDYAKGTFTRYLVTRRNDPSEPMKEVDAEFSSPLYKKFSIQWQLTGRVKDVFIANRRTVEQAEPSHPGVANVLNNFIEYYVIPEVSDSTKIRRSLGILNIPKDKDGNVVVPPPASSLPTNRKPSKKKSKRGHTKSSGQTASSQNNTGNIVA